jgi:hypothetical protein
MSVMVSEKALRDLLKDVLFEAVPSAGPAGSGQSGVMAPGGSVPGSQTRGGMFDRPLKAKDESDPNFHSTLPDEVPIQASDMMASQLVDERPPIEDPSYVPTNVVELSRAAAAVGKQVPVSEIANFYQRLLQLLEDAEIDASSPEEVETVETAREEKQVEMAIRNGIQKILREQDAASMSSDEAPYQDIMQVTGHSAESGARQYILRAVDRLGYAVKYLTDDEIDDLIAYGVLEFISALQEDEAIDETDAVELKMNPRDVEQMGFFRNFLTQGIVLPAYQQLQRTVKKKIVAELEALGVPSASHGRMVSFFLGEPPQDEEKLLVKMKADATTAGMDINAIDSLESSVSQELSRLKDASVPDENLRDIAKQRWERRTIANKLDLLDKARQESLQDMSSEEMKKMFADG